MNSLLTPLPHSPSGFYCENSPTKTTSKAFPAGDLEAARIAWRLKVDSWSTLELRKDFADEFVMRCHIKAAGLRSPHPREPATAKRLRTLLKRAMVNGHETCSSLGTDLHGFLELNPRLPLWAALALVLESTGRFTRLAMELAKGAPTA